MVERLRAAGSRHRAPAAMAEVPRERFVRRVPARGLRDHPLDIGSAGPSPRRGSSLSLPPRRTFGPGGRVWRSDRLRHGAACSPAVACHVVTIERSRRWPSGPGPRSRRWGRNVEVRTGDAPGRARTGAFRRVVVTAMATARPPPACRWSWRRTGTMVCPVGRRGKGVLTRYRAAPPSAWANVVFVRWSPAARVVMVRPDRSTSLRPAVHRCERLFQPRADPGAVGPLGGQPNRDLGSRCRPRRKPRSSPW